MTIDTKRHLESMMQTSLALEEQLRANGHYSRDCKSIDAAIARGKKRGVALLWNSDDALEVVDLNGGAEHVEVKNEGNRVSVAHGLEGFHNPGPDEKMRRETAEMVQEVSTAPYRQMNEGEFEKAVAQSHEPGNKTKGRFNPVSIAADAAQIAKRKQMAADARRFTEEQFARNERIAAQQKAFWNKKGA